MAPPAVKPTNTVEDEPDPSVQATPEQDDPGVQDLVVVESAFGERLGYWWSYVVVENPNNGISLDAGPDSPIVVEALDETGGVLDSIVGWDSFAPGRKELVALFPDVGEAQVASLRIDIPATSQFNARPPSEGEGRAQVTAGEVTEGVSPDGMKTLTAPLHNVAEEDLPFVLVALIIRTSDGKVTQVFTDMVEELPAGGVTTFDVALLPDEQAPEGSTFEVAFP
ncbi:hypothetical protein GCM10007967_14400 [Xylanimonas ulmi]